MSVAVKFSEDEMKKEASFVSHISLLLHLCPKDDYVVLDNTAGVLPSLETP